VPAKSKAQLRKLGALEARGEVKPGTTAEFGRASKKQHKKLPERVGKKGAGAVGLAGATDRARRGEHHH
jgi:hypothetical protein